ncbi:MAG: PTS sugar transporter subunit IIA [Rhodobiaceae bacterium]
MIRPDLMPGILLCRHPVTSRKQLLESLCSRVARHGNLDERLVLDAVLDREKLGSTAIGDGIALPHATIAGAAATSTLLATLEQPVDFDSPDGKPVDIVMLVLGGDRDGAGHLAALGVVSRQLRASGDFLRAADSEAALYDAVAGRLVAA